MHDLRQPKKGKAANPLEPVAFLGVFGGQLHEDEAKLPKTSSDVVSQHHKSCLI